MYTVYGYVRICVCTYTYTQALGSLISLTSNFNKTGDQVEKNMAAVWLPRLLVSLEVSDSEDTGALIV